MNVKVIGKGAWGSALYHVLAQNLPDVGIVSRGEVISDADVIVLSVPTQSIRDVLVRISVNGKVPAIVNTAKGIEQSTHKFPHEIVSDVLGSHVPYYSLIGPSFASEVKQNMPTLVNLGYSKERKENEKIRELFQTDSFRVRLTEGVEVLELAGALKNVYAIASGFADGLGYKINTRTKLLVLAIEEVYELINKRGLALDSRSTAGTVGDLVLTCTSIESRNYRFGKYLVSHPTQEALKLVQATVEGFHTLESIDYLEKSSGTSMRLARFIRDIVSLEDPEARKLRFDELVRKS